MCQSRQLKRINLGGNTLLSGKFLYKPIYTSLSTCRAHWARPLGIARAGSGEHLPYTFPSWGSLCQVPTFQPVNFTLSEIEVLFVRMCEHGGTKVFNIGQNNLALVPEFPFSLVISKMREVNLITSKFSWPSLSSRFLLVIIMIAIIAIIYIGEPNQSPGQARLLLTQVADDLHWFHHHHHHQNCFGCDGHN